MATRSLRFTKSIDRIYRYRFMNVGANAYGSWDTNISADDVNSYAIEIEFNRAYDDINSPKFSVLGAIDPNPNYEYIPPRTIRYYIDWELSKSNPYIVELVDVKTIKHSPTFDFNVKHGDVYVNGRLSTDLEYFTSENGSKPNSIKIVAHDGYEINNVTYEFKSYLPGGEETEYGINSKEYILDVYNDPLAIMLYVTFNTVEIDEPGGDDDDDDIPIGDGAGHLPFSSVYSIDYNNLIMISRKYGRLHVDSEGKLYTDPISEMINNIIKLPFTLNDDVKGDLEYIIFGTISDTVKDIQAKPLLNTVVKVQLGEIEVEGKYGNALDYINANVYVTVPFMDKIELPIEYVMNSVVTIEYYINAFTGDVTCNFKSSLTGNSFHSENGIIADEIPFYSTVKNDISNRLDKLVTMNNVYRPFIEVVRNIPIQDNESKIYMQGTLENVTGNVKVMNFNIKSDIIKTERDMILNILESGVKINE